jgi:sugar-specific transcriptional regulator TrmB
VKGSLIVNATWQRLCEYLGLSEYEAKIYVSLIEAGQAKARTLSVLSGVPRTKVYSVLRKLMDMGLVIEVPGEPRRFSPVSPSVALRSYLQSYRDTVQNLSSLISTLEDAFKKARRKENTVRIATNENGLILLYKSFNKLFDELVERSVQIKIITTNGPANKHLIRELRYMCSIEEASFRLPLIILCVDEDQLLISHLNPDSYFLKSAQDRAIFSNDPVLQMLVWSLIAQMRR